MNGEKIREARKKLNLTQAEFGELFGKTGNTIARWERDEIKFDSPKILEWALIGLETVKNAEKQKAEIIQMQFEIENLLQVSRSLLQK